MKLVRFSTPAAGPMIGVTDGARLVSLSDAIPDVPRDMIGLIEQWPSYAKRISGIREFDLELRHVRLHSPIARPGKIFAIGLNYADHAAEGGLPPSTEQLWFSKASTAVNGPYDPIERPIVSDRLDYEAELVVVIGRRSRHLSRASAMQAIFGYCVGNDVSVRDWQTMTTQVTLGKSFDTHAPFGPWIATADVVDPSDLTIWTTVNGQERQRSRTSKLIFDVAAQLSHLSKAMTLEPGDVIFTGTPAGVGAAMKPPVWLKAGDIVRIEIEKIGHIENRVVDEKAPAQ